MDKFKVNDYVWFGNEICQVIGLFGVDEYCIRECNVDGSRIGGFYVHESEIKPATDDEYTQYMGEDEDNA